MKSLERFEPLERRMMLSSDPVGGEFLINTFTPSRQHAVSVDFHADGDFVAAWASVNQDGSGDGVYAQRFNAAGAPQGPEFQVNTFTQSDQTAPAVAVAPDGTFVIAWMSQFQGGFTFGDIYLQRYGPDGAPLGGEMRVNATTAADQREPAIAMDEDGAFVITWSGNGIGDDRGIFAQRFDFSGIPRGGEFRINSHTPTTQLAPSVAMDPAGNFTVAWTSQVQDGSGSGVYAQRFDASGAPQGPEFLVNTYTESDQANPSVAVDADGDAVITWMSLGQDGHIWGIFAKRFDAAGNAQGDEFPVNTYTADYQMSPSVAIDADGDFVIAWESTGPGGAGFDIHARQFNAAGAPLGDQFMVNTTTAAQQQTPVVAMRGSGEFLIAWHDNLQDDGLDGGVYAQRYAAAEPAPAVLASSFDFDTAPHRLSFTFNQDISATLGTEDLVVQNLTSGHTFPAADFSLAWNSATNTATFTYTGATAGIAGMLADGQYRATLLSSGTSLPSDHVYEFLFLSGDANHDGRVNLEDFNILAANFGGTDKTFSEGDFNYDRGVNLDDFNILASRFGTTLSPGGMMEVGRGLPPSLGNTRRIDDGADEPEEPATWIEI